MYSNSVTQAQFPNPQKVTETLNNKIMLDRMENFMNYKSGKNISVHNSYTAKCIPATKGLSHNTPQNHAVYQAHSKATLSRHNTVQRIILLTLLHFDNSHL